MARKPLAERIKGKFTVDANGCHIWTGKFDRHGAPTMFWIDRPDRVRRVVYREHGGDPAFEAVSLCHVKACINPEHIGPGETYRGTKKLTEVVELDWSFLDDPDFMERFERRVRRVAGRKRVSPDDAFQEACLWLAARPERLEREEHMEYLAEAAIGYFAKHEWKIVKNELTTGEFYGMAD